VRSYQAWKTFITGKTQALESPSEITIGKTRRIIVIPFDPQLAKNKKSPLGGFDFTVKQRKLAGKAKIAKNIEELEDLVHFSAIYFVGLNGLN
jgi:hypothetical protein